MKRYLGQVGRSKVKVTKSKNVPLTSDSLVYGQIRNSGIQLVGMLLFPKHMQFHTVGGLG